MDYYNYFQGYGKFTIYSAHINERHEKAHKLRRQGVPWDVIVKEVDTVSRANAQQMCRIHQKRLEQFDLAKFDRIKLEQDRFNKDQAEAKAEFTFLLQFLPQIKELANG